MCSNDKQWKRCTPSRYLPAAVITYIHTQRDILLQSFSFSTYILIFVALASLFSSFYLLTSRVILPPLLYLEFPTSCCRRGIRATRARVHSFSFSLLHHPLSTLLFLPSPPPFFPFLISYFSSVFNHHSSSTKCKKMLFISIYGLCLISQLGSYPNEMLEPPLPIIHSYTVSFPEIIIVPHPCHLPLFCSIQCV